MIPVHLFVVSFLGWLQSEQPEIIQYLRQENRVLKEQLRTSRIRFTDDQRRRLAGLGAPLGRRLLMQIATIVTADTLLRWHRQLIAQKWTYSARRPGRPNVLPEIRRLVLRMATENPGWGYTRLQGALKNLGHRVARSTVATILKQHGVPPSPERPTSWDCFVIELESRRFRIIGSTPQPDDAFMRQIVRELTNASDGVLRERRFLICDRDRKWSAGTRSLLEASGVCVIQTPFRAPNCNAYAERLVRSIKEECLDRLILLGERHLRRALAEFVAHYHRERNHQGLGNELIEDAREPPTRSVQRRQRLGSATAIVVPWRPHGSASRRWRSL